MTLCIKQGSLNYELAYAHTQKWIGHRAEKFRDKSGAFRHSWIPVLQTCLQDTFSVHLSFGWRWLHSWAAPNVNKHQQKRTISFLRVQSQVPGRVPIEPSWIKCPCLSQSLCSEEYMDLSHMTTLGSLKGKRGQPYPTMWTESWEEVVKKQKEGKKECWAHTHTFQSD